MPGLLSKLALIGALFGLGAFGAYEYQLLVAAQILIVVALVGQVLAYLRHRNAWIVGAALLSAGAVFAGLYLAGSEALVYTGFAGLVVASATDFWNRWKANR